MATYDYTTLQATAERLLTKFGQNLTFTRRVRTGRDRVTATADITETSYTVTAVVLPYKTHQTYGSGFDESARVDLVNERSRFMVVSGQDLATPPQKDDEVSYESHTWKVSGSTPINPGGTTLVYRVGIRR